HKEMRLFVGLTLSPTSFHKYIVSHKIFWCAYQKHLSIPHNDSNSIWQTLSAIFDKRDKTFAYPTRCVCQILFRIVLLNLLKALSVKRFHIPPARVPTAQIR